VILLNIFISEYRIGAVEVKLLSPRAMATISIILSFTFFVVFYVCSYILKVPVITIALLLIIAYIIFALSKQLNHTNAVSVWTVAFVSGPIVVLTVFSALQALGGITDLFVSVAVGILLIIYLTLKARRFQRLEVDND
jgi:hypothetical protein